MSLISCLPALEHAELRLAGTLRTKKLCCLLEALAWCPRLTFLGLLMWHSGRADGGLAMQPVPTLPPFAKLRNLTELVLNFGTAVPCTLPNVVDALAALTGLADLFINYPKAAVVPAALAQLKALQWLSLHSLQSCVLAAGCLNLPTLAHLEFHACHFEDREVLRGVTALQSLTRIEFSGGKGPRFFDPQLVQLKRLQCMIYEAATPWRTGLSSLPADMGSLSTGLLHVDFSGRWLAPFPLV